MARRKYCGVSLEAASYGTKTALAYYLDIAGASLDTPDSPELIHPGGLSRFPTAHQAGAYIPVGNVEFIFDVSTMQHILEMCIGGAVTFTDNTTAVAPEQFGSTSGGTTLTGTASTVPIVPGTLIVEVRAGADVAGDDSFGNITAIAASGVTGTVNYTTGAITLAGLQDPENYDIDYNETDTAGFYNTVFTPSVADEQKDVTLSIGKDQFMHTFTGCVFNGLAIAVEKEWVTVTTDVIAKIDEKETIATEAAVLLKSPRPETGSAYYMPFHKVTAKMVDYGSSLAAFESTLEALTINLVNGGDGESGVTLGSRNPRRQFLGEMEASGDMTLVFDGTDELEDFWGGSTTSSAVGTQEKAVEFTFSSNTSIGDVVLLFPKVLFQQVAIQGSGRERIVQELKWVAIYDTSVSYNLQATCNCLYNWESNS